jgi:hypothetical protein
MNSSFCTVGIFSSNISFGDEEVDEGDEKEGDEKEGDERERDEREGDATKGGGE